MNKQFIVESGEERWDYDSDIPTREVIDYWVKLGNEVVKKFSYRKDAEDYSDKLNKATQNIK